MISNHTTEYVLQSSPNSQYKFRFRLEQGETEAYIYLQVTKEKEPIARNAIYCPSLKNFINSSIEVLHQLHQKKIYREHLGLIFCEDFQYGNSLLEKLVADLTPAYLRQIELEAKTLWD